MLRACVALYLALTSCQSAAAPIYRPEQARRTINTDTYELVIQKNSQIDLLTLAGEPIVDNAFPSVLLEGGVVKPLAIDFRNTRRFSVKGPLGQGTGFHYVSPECEWKISVYPADPFITVELTYINDTKKPVTVVGLSPFGIGGTGKGGVYFGDHGGDVRVLRPATADDPFARIGADAQRSPGHFGAYAPRSGRIIVAGFLTSQAATGTVTLAHGEATQLQHFDSFESVCVFNEPVVVGPGERLSAETFYLAIVEHDPQAGLERFAAAVRKMNSGESGAALSLPASAPGAVPLADWGLASRQYYLPTTGRLHRLPWQANIAEATHHFDDNQFITALTLAAIHGGLADSPEGLAELPPLRRHIVSRLLPAPARGGRPVDLFQAGPPQQWYLPLESPAGNWTIAALFNWDAGAPVELNTPLTAIGLNNDNLYTVYDYWAGRYLGLIEKTLRVEVPPEGVRLLGLRRYERRPMLVATSQHFTLGAKDPDAGTWSHDVQTLTGAFEAGAAEERTISVLIPEPYALKNLDANAEITARSQSEKVLTVTLRAKTAGTVRWTLSF